MDKPWIKWGVIGALASFVFGSAILLTLGFSQTASNLQYIGFLIVLGAIVMAITEVKKANGGFIGFGDAFKVGAFTVLIMAALGAVLTFVQFSFIAPSDYQDLILAEAQKEWEKAGMDDGAMASAESMTRGMTSPVAMSLIGGIMSILLGMLLALIASLALKREQAV